MTRRTLSAMLALSVALGAAPARASDPKADALFQEAKTAMEQGKYDVACPKLEEARRIDGGGGIVLALAVCHEKSGHAARALETYRDALVLAQAASRKDRIDFAEKRIADLEAHVGRLLVVVKDAPDVEISVDGATWARARWNVATPIDGGKHVLEAHAPGKIAFRTEFSLPPIGDVRRIEVPALESEGTKKAPQPAAPVTTTSTPTLVPQTTTTGPSHDVVQPHGSGALRTTSFVVMGLGVASLGVGTYFGVHALSLQSSARDACTSGYDCGPDAMQKQEDAHSAGRISTITFIAGGALVATGAVLFFVSRDTAVAPVPMQGGAGLGFFGRF